ncbi:MAG: hypothetical protein AWU57_309 [Marinobacter sp. T13-3]|nr:MAG: hypothetical protein AWU57_309 [Marinobacter sp. T13-3]
MSVLRQSILTLAVGGLLAGSGVAVAKDDATDALPNTDSLTTQAQTAADVTGAASGEGSPDSPKTLADLTMETSDEMRRGVCGLIQQAATELSSNMPIKVDDATNMVHAETTYEDGFCTYILRYEVDEESLLNRLQGVLSDAQDKEMPMEVVQQFYQTGGPGYAVMQNGVRGKMMADPAFADVANIPFVEVQATFVMQGDLMDDFTLVMGQYASE